MSTKPSLKCPSRNDVDLAIRQLEIEEEREKEAIRTFWKREREQAPMVVTGKGLLWFMAKLVFWSALVAAFVIGWLSL